MVYIWGKGVMFRRRHEVDSWDIVDVLFLCQDDSSPIKMIFWAVYLYFEHFSYMLCFKTNTICYYIYFNSLEVYILLKFRNITGNSLNLPRYMALCQESIWSNMINVKHHFHLKSGSEKGEFSSLHINHGFILKW